MKRSDFLWRDLQTHTGLGQDPTTGGITVDPPFFEGGNGVLTSTYLFYNPLPLLGMFSFYLILTLGSMAHVQENSQSATKRTKMPKCLDLLIILWGHTPMIGVR